MSFASLTLAPLIFGFGLLYWSSTIEEENNLLKHLFRLMFFPLMLLTLHLGILDVGLNYSADAETVALLGDIVWYIGLMIYIIGAYYFFVVLGKLKDWFMEKRESKEREKYGE